MGNLFLVFLLIVSFIIFVIDIKKLYIPNTINIIFFVMAVCYRGFDLYKIENGILGAGVYTLPLLFFYGYGSDLAQKEIMGFGDIKLMIGIGYSDFYTIYIYYLETFVIAALFGIVYIVKKKTVRGEIAFSPFLLFSFYCILFMERV
jgi:leader peptidase (prepilin peptidase)/N-methyltransferase